MRIIAGRFRGRRLHGPGRAAIRPTSDALRETLFNVLGPGIEGLRVVDGFAGTGALGLEALSRGAAEVTFVERDQRAIRVLEANVALCGSPEACAIIRDDFLGIATRRGLGHSSDLVLVDPPYDLKDLDAVLGTAASLAVAGGRVVLEHSRRRAVPESVSGLRQTRVLVAGDSALSFYAASTP